MAEGPEGLGVEQVADAVATEREDVEARRLRREELRRPIGIAAAVQLRAAVDRQGTAGGEGGLLERQGEELDRGAETSHRTLVAARQVERVALPAPRHRDGDRDGEHGREDPDRGAHRGRSRADPARHPLWSPRRVHPPLYLRRAGTPESRATSMPAIRSVTSAPPYAISRRGRGVATRQAWHFAPPHGRLRARSAAGLRGSAHQR